jgi:essential nuclear protein 1
MSLKKIKKVQAPGHDVSLVDAELKARSGLAVPRTCRRKQKVIDDPTLGADMTARILKTAAQQREEIEDDEGRPVAFHFPHADDAEDADADDATIDLETELETTDPATREFFELFNSIASGASRQLDRSLLSTRHQADPAVRAVYTQLGSVLRVWRSGRLPKAVTTLASQKVPGWLDLLQLSQPLSWSAAALEAVTILFAQSASDGHCRKFYHEILLVYVRELLDTARRLPPPIFKALVIAARRPHSFVTGVLLPLSQETHATMKDARVIAAIAGKVRLPRDHANAFLIKLCSAGEVTNTRTIFVARFIAKGQALAVEAIDAILGYFMAFLQFDEKQPLLWHHALVDFVKRYGRDLTQEQRDAVTQLVAKHSRHHVTPEVFKYFREVPPREENSWIDVAPVPEL